MTETGQNVQLNVEVENNTEPGLAQTQLQPTEVQIVLGVHMNFRTVTRNPVLVSNVYQCCLRLSSIS